MYACPANALQHAMAFVVVFSSVGLFIVRTSHHNRRAILSNLLTTPEPPTLEIRHRVFGAFWTRRQKHSGGSLDYEIAVAPPQSGNIDGSIWPDAKQTERFDLQHCSNLGNRIKYEEPASLRARCGIVSNSQESRELCPDKYSDSEH